jgi:TRAP-type C4-dicarboxylate transport system permease small subunit
MSWLDRVLRLVLAGLMGLAMINLLIGVFLRYVMIEITDFFDLDMIRYTWVEEVGELALAYMALIGAAVGIRERAHFTLHLGVTRLPERIQRAIGVFNAVLIVAFGALAAWQAWGLSVLNSLLTSPALEINLAWLYGSAVLGGVLIALYGLRMLTALRRGRTA